MKILTGLFILLLCSSFSELRATVFYVNQYATGSDNGQNWENAYRDLQTALANAQAGDELWVVSGNYYPTSENDRYATFTLKTGVRLYGGFVGNELALTDRNWEENPTFLNGDIGLPGNHGDNSYSVVTIIDPDENTVLDGFEIRNGSANDRAIETHTYDPARRGGGVLIQTTGKDADYALTIRNTRFFNNNAEYGGAVFGDARERNNISISFQDCDFELNQADQGSAYNTDSGNLGPLGLQFIDCSFVQNRSEIHGLLYILTATGQPGALTVQDCDFTENEGDLLRLSVATQDHPFQLLISGSSFRSNISNTEGFGLLHIFTQRQMDMVLDSVVFRANEGYDQIIGLGEPHRVRLNNTLFVGNSVITLVEGRPRFLEIDNCDFFQNNLDRSAIFAHGEHLDIRNSVWRNNRAAKILELNPNNLLGTNFYEDGAAVQITQSRLRDNSADQLLLIGGDSLRINGLRVSDTEAGPLGEVWLSANWNLVINSLFSRPQVFDGKGAVGNGKADSELDIVNSTFYNFTDSETGATLIRVEDRNDTDATRINISNTIIWDNLEPDHPIFSLQNAAVTLSHNLLPGNHCDSIYRTPPTVYGEILPAVVTCGETNLFGLAPRFRDVANDDFGLTPCSPAVNRGNLLLLPDTVRLDLAGQDRIVHTQLDLGAYEFQASLVAIEVETDIVPASGAGQGDGSITLTAVSGGTPDYNYAWSTGETAETIGGLLPGTYTLTVTDEEGCTQTFAFELDFSNPVVDPQVSWGAQIFPNPVGSGQSGRLHFRDPSFRLDGLRLLSPHHGVIWERNFGALFPGQDYRIPLPPENGFYLLEISGTDGKRGYLRWLVQ